MVSWAIDDMLDCKPSDLGEILEAREAKITEKHSFAKKIRENNQLNPTLKWSKQKDRGSIL